MKIRVLLVSNQRPNMKGVGNPVISRMRKSLQGDERLLVDFLPFENNIASLVRIRKASKSSDVVHIHFGGLYALFVYLFIMGVHVVKIITFHGTDIHAKAIKTTKGVGKKLKIKLNQYASFLSVLLFDRVGFVSEEMKAYMPALLRKKAKEKFFLQKLGVDYNAFAPMERASSLQVLNIPDARYILFSDINNTHIKRRDIAENIVKELGDGHQLLIMSGVDSDMVPHYINVCDFLLLTSDEEGSPNIIRECLAMNKPVFCVAVGDVQQQLEGLTNSCIISRTPQQAAMQIREHITQPYVDNTRETRRNVIDFDVVNRFIIDVYISETSKRKWMKIVNIFGGLGNQMFQYALIEALKSKYGEVVLADIHYFKDCVPHNGYELETIFPVKLQYASAKDVKRLAFYEPNYKLHRIIKHLHIKKRTTILELLSKPYHEDVFVESSRYYDGYWQDPRYFEGLRDVLAERFAFKLQLDGRNFSICQQIEACQSVGIHVRRGDYLKKKRYRGVCDVDYYAKAIEYVRQQVHSPHFFVFSNDMEWCKENLLGLLDGNYCLFVDWNCGKDSYKDMQLMTRCHSLIMANSSFSWWAAYLNNRANVIVAPQIWFHSYPPLQIQLKDWYLL